MRAKKRFGQHFLSDNNILTAIVDAAEIAPDETVLEVGPGLGALTAVLAERARRVVAVEVDRDLIAGLRTRFADAPHVTIVEGDVLELSVADVLGFTGGEFTAEPQRTQREDGEQSDVAQNVGLADRAPHPQPLSTSWRGELLDRGSAFGCGCEKGKDFVPSP